VIRKSYEMLCQEPWCFPPAVVGKLTDWQIEHLYALPAARRAEEMRKDVPGGGGLPHPPPDPGPEPEPGSPEHRRRVVSALVNGPLAVSPERAAAIYESQLAAYRNNGG
jgi:hypothetical protein